MRVIISAGGSGGHIYPALAIINKIKESEPDSKFLYIGTHNRMEKDIIPGLGIDFVPITIYGLKRSLSFDNIKNISNYFKAIKKCKKEISKFKPDIVIGVGGYVTAPVIYSAKKLGYKTFIHEQNSVVGLSNKYLSKYADIIAVSFESTLNEFDKNKTVFTGNPCGDKAMIVKKANKKDYGFSDNKKLVIIVMGSLGSGTVNDRILSMLDKFKNKDYEIAFITGSVYYDKVKDNKFPSNVKVFPYINDMPALMKASDLMVSRAGATTISEIVSLRIPSIFVPSPYLPNNHQYKNAMDLVNKKAALILEEKELENDNLVNMIDDILNNKNKYLEIKNNLEFFKVNDSSTKIYEIIRKLVDKNE